jgi:hypothetical protein
MDHIDFDHLSEVMEEVLSCYQDAVTRYGAKRLFDLLKKKKSCGYNEMSPTFAIERIEFLSDPAAERPAQTAKLAVLDFIVGMMAHGDTEPLDIVNRMFGKATHSIPEVSVSQASAAKTLSKITNAANTESAQAVKALLEAFAGDGVVDSQEATKVEKEAMEAASAWLEAAAVAKAIREAKVKKGKV